MSCQPSCPPAPPRAHLPGHGVHDLRQPQARGAERSPPLLQQGGKDRGGGVSGGQHPQAASTVPPPRLHHQSDSSPQPELNDQLSMFDVQQQCIVNAALSMYAHYIGNKTRQKSKVPKYIGT